MSIFADIIISEHSKLKTLRRVYNVFRSILFTAILLAVALFIFLYVAVAIPPVQNYIREKTEKEFANFLGSKVEIGDLSIRPVNEIIIHDVKIYDLNKSECVRIDKLGAGINLWQLILKANIEITYVELLDFNVNIYQKKENAPFNIQFIIDAFAPKDKNKEPTKFDLKIHNIVIRGGNASFSRYWKPKNKEDIFDPNYIIVSDLCADVTIPRLSNDYSEIDLRRLSLNEKSGLQIKEIKGLFKIRTNNLTVTGLSIALPESLIKVDKTTLPLSFFEKNDYSSEIALNIQDSRITPSNLSAFYPPLSNIDIPLPFALSASINKQNIHVDNFQLGDKQSININFKGNAANFSYKNLLDIDVDNLSVTAQTNFLRLISDLIPQQHNKELVNTILNNTGELGLNLSGNFNAENRHALFNSDLIASGLGSIKISGNTFFEGNDISGELNIDIPELDFNNLLPDIPMEYIAKAQIGISGKLNTKYIGASNGKADFHIGDINLLNRSISAIDGTISKNNDICSLNLQIKDTNLDGEVDATVVFAGEKTEWNLEAKLKDFNTYYSYLADTRSEGYEMRGSVSAKAVGNNIDNITGNLLLSDFTLTKGNGKNIFISDLSLSIDNLEDTGKAISLNSEIIDCNIEGNYIISQIPSMVKRTLHETCPAFFSPVHTPGECGEGRFEIAIKDARQIINFFELPVFPLTELTIEGSFDSKNDNISLFTEIPYIQQGHNNLITDTYLKADINGSEKSLALSLGTVYPTKKGLLKLDVDINGDNNKYNVFLDFNRGRDVSFYGDINLNLLLDRDPATEAMEIEAHWLPSSLYLNSTEWNVEEAEIKFNGRNLTIKDFCIRHADQFLSISGYNNMEGKGTINLTLSDIDLDYIFDTLNINHVSFGGKATGEIIAENIFSGEPLVETKKLTVNQLSYNGAVIGNGDIFSKLYMKDKKIGIGAKITEGEKLVATVDGGVWFGRDSLSFAFNADRINIAFMQPFMKAFSSDVTGSASGKALLYGTFSDIDMTGSIIAHDASIKIDYINAYYTGSDTVYLKPGRIEIPHFTVYDKYGNSALVEGELTHKFFHEPSFRFKVSDLKNLLVYDTNATNNPIWYGKIFASGTGEITGKPGFVNIAADVQTRKGSDFTFVLSDQQEAVKSHFLTFTDKRKAAQEALVSKDTMPDFLKKFRKTKIVTEESPDIFSMDLRVSVTDDAKLNLIMDPIQGDKITAYGSGAMTMIYSSFTDELKLYGKYILDKGTYNFSLQDIILKEFTIKPGSSIAFTGNPYTGILDITAAYRVNTSLTELDNSFANDRELNRTSVPVEALLNVTGVLTSPHITFDIELPTVTEETAQKVRSIISTEDMMSRQVLYLVALNKFYPPEYMSTSNSGGEWASVASSTISSQIQNVLGQLTDKVTVAPSIRSDKGDFSDIEVDLALSSQLFNNRLLLNGNLGYRDPANSSTTFVGDFDLEYLLNRRGTWRLKAYNHFNDQNYYLKSALTTQGIGLIWRLDFGNPRTKEKKEEEKTEKK